MRTERHGFLRDDHEIVRRGLRDLLEAEVQHFEHLDSDDG